MNYRVTLGFLAALIAISLVVFGLDRFNIGPSPGADATATSVAGQNLQILQFDDTQVSAIELRQGERSTRVTRSGDAWTLAETGEPANRSSFNSLGIRMSQLRATRRLDSPSPDLKEYGLDPPSAQVTAELEDGTRHELLLGERPPLATGRYAKIGAAPDIYVISDQFNADIERLVNDPKEPPTPTPASLETPGPSGTPTP